MSANSAPHGGWISLMDYAMKKGVSLSTLRRYIKANKIRFKSEHGRYLIWDEDAGMELDSPSASSTDKSTSRPRDFRAAGQSNDESARKIEELELKLRQAQEEISELKMLVALYEEQFFQKPTSLQI